MKLTTAALRPLLDDLFIDMGLADDKRYSIAQDLVSLLETNSIHDIEIIRPDDSNNSSWMIRIHKVSGQVLGEFALPSRLENGNYDVEQYIETKLTPYIVNKAEDNNE